MVNRLAVCLVVGTATLGCAASRTWSTATPSTAASSGASPRRIQPGTYSLKITAATIESRRPDGSPWHVRPADNSAAVAGAALGLAAGNPQLGMRVGAAFADQGGDPEAPVPYVTVKLAGATWTVAPVHRSYAPTWDQMIEINAWSLAGDERVIIQLFDAIDDALLAQVEMPLASLLETPSQTLTNISASVRSLDMRAQLTSGAPDAIEYEGRGD